MQETELLDMISKESSWEEVIEYIVAEEGMDPWDIDIVRLSDAFITYLSGVKNLDFRVPARLIIISAILIRMKADIMSYEEKHKEEKQKAEELGLDLSAVPDLSAPVTRVPTRKVTLDELVSALDKAFSTKKRREKREYSARERVEEVVNSEDSFDISAKIDEIYSSITNVLKELRDGELKFSSLVTKWTKKDVVESFLPVLHLDNEGRVSLSQENHFDEIYIRLRDDEEGED